jgi:DNA-binding beta-propeller fold protein YncE
MINRFLIALVAVAVATLATGAPAPVPTFTVSKYAVGGDGGTDYLLAEPGSGRVFISRGTHVMIVDGPTGKVTGDIPDTPRVHGIALVKKWNHGFTTNGGDSTVTMFDLQTLAVQKRIPVPVGGLDGIMYDEFSDHIVLTTHSRPGTVTVIGARDGELAGATELEDNSPEGAASDGMGRIFVNNEGKSTMQVVDEKTMKAEASWPLAPCDGPTGIAYDRATRRIFVGCSGTSVVLDSMSGQVVATIANGNGVDALAWDASQKLLYIPAGRDGTVTVVHQDSADRYTTVATVTTMVGAKTIALDPEKHLAYLLAVQYGPAPVAAAAAPSGAVISPPFGARGPVIGAQFFVLSH